MKDGLSDEYVTCFAQDKNGFIWMGTSNGLNRYDGNSFKTFFHNPVDSNSLCGNDISQIVFDHNNMLWVNTNRGLCLYDQKTGTFKPITRDSDNEKICKDFAINHVYEDKNNIIWVLTDKGNYYVDRSYRIIKNNSFSRDAPSSLEERGIRFLSTGNNGIEWIFDEKYLFRLKSGTKEIDRQYTLPATSTSSIFQDSEGHFWLTTTDKGIFRFNPDDGSFISFKLPTSEKRFHNIGEWSDGRSSWLIIPGFSLYFINVKTWEVTIASANKFNKSSYQGTYWSRCFIDKDNRLWMGYERGVSVVQMNLQHVSIIPLTSPGDNAYEEPEYGLANVIHADSDGFWIAKWWGKSGIYCYSPDWTLRKFLPSSSLIIPGKTDLQKRVYDFKTDSNYLYATTDDGLLIINKNNWINQLIPVPQGTDSYLRRMEDPANGKLYIRSMGLHVFDKLTKKFITYYHPRDIFEDETQQLQTMILKKNGLLLLATATGYIAEYNLYDKSFSRYQLKTSRPVGFPAIMRLIESESGDLWATTNSGAVVFNAATHMLIKEFPENRIMGRLSHIVQDSNHTIWVNNRSALWCYVPQKEKWFSLNSRDGFPAEVYGDNDMKILPGGNMLTGIGEKAIIFDKGFIKGEINASAPVLITEAKAGDDRAVNFSSNMPKEITVKPGQVSVSVDFAVLDYDRPSGIKYFYKLEPEMTDFKENPSSHLLFSGLKPGQYILRVKGGNKLGIPGKEEDILSIFVKPQWYQTTLFWMTLFFLATGIMYFSYRARIRSVKKDAAIRQRIAETEMQALRAQMNPHFIFNSLNSIENFILQNEKRLASDYLNKFSKLIRSILDSSRNELVPFTKDMESLQLYVDLEQLRFNNKFAYKSIIDPELLRGDYKVPSLIIQPFVENAIVHGLAQSEQSGLQLLVMARIENDTIEYIVQDNGIGREKSLAYKQQNKPQHKSIGLQITEERIKTFNRSAANAVEFTDLFDAGGDPCGTRVRITINAL